jgi:hypothetical protein
MDKKNDYNSIPMQHTQTAVEWLIQQIDNQDMGEIPMWIYDFCEKAKQMEKEQIINAYESYPALIMSAEEYYNQTYNNENTNGTSIS